MVANLETEDRTIESPLLLHKPLFSARFVADNMPGFNPELPKQTWNFTSSDSDGPIKITITSEKDETTATIKNYCQAITALKTVERPDRGIWQVEQYVKGQENPIWSIGTTLYFIGKFYEEKDGIGIMPEINNASQAPRRTRQGINLDHQMINSSKMWEWFQISRAFIRLEDALSTASLVEKVEQPKLF